MATSGIKDIIVTNQIVTPSKINRLIALAKYANISVPIDNFYNAKHLSEAANREGVKLEVLVDVHLESNRCGVEPGEPTLKLAKSIQRLKGLKFRGLMGFEGQISWLEPREKRRTEIERLEGLLTNTKELIEKSGISVVEVSTGTTGTYDVSGKYPGVTEVQAGSYILMDANYNKFVPEFDCALSVLSTVISKPSHNRVITDTGLMSISSTYGKPLVVGNDIFEVSELHAENTVLKIKKPKKIEIGDKIEFLPTYLDGTVNLHDKFYGIRRDKVEVVWKILGRGRSN